MAIVRWSPMWDLFQQMEEMMNHFPAMSRDAQNAFVPALDMYETDGAVVVETPLAGVDPKEVTVTVQKGVLTVSGEMKKEHEVDEKNYYRKEVRSGSFYRQVALPTPVKDDAVTAEFNDGVLKITCPKAAPTATKKIDVVVHKK